MFLRPFHKSFQNAPRLLEAVTNSIHTILIWALLGLPPLILIPAPWITAFGLAFRGTQTKTFPLSLCPLCPSYTGFLSALQIFPILGLSNKLSPLPGVLFSLLGKSLG